MGSSTKAPTTTAQPKTTTTTTATGTSPFAQGLNGGSGIVPQAQLQPKNTTITDTSIASQPDAIASLNSVMQSLFGRLATSQEMSRYIPELLAAQRANPSRGQDVMKYDENTWRPLQGVNTMTSTSVNPEAFFTSILQGSAEASQYRVLGTYMDSLKNMINSTRGTFSG